MVRRSAAAKDNKKGNRRAAKSSKRGGGDEEYQQPGKLMLNNPLIPAELDEDIDDDLAFNSEDERLYGEFFANKASSEPKLVKKKPKKAQRAAAESDDDDDDDGFLEDGLAVVSKTEKKNVKKSAGKRLKSRAAADECDEMVNYHEDGQSSNDDEDYIDLSDMLDMNMKEEKKKKKAKSKMSSRVTESGTKVSKKRRVAALTAEPESVYGLADATESGGAGSYNDAMRRIMRQKESTSNAELDAVRGRIEKSLRSKHNLLTVDADDMTKDRLTRREVRSIVDESMERYKPILKELDSAKHLQFPMHLPDSTPVASSVGGIVAAADAQFRSDRAVPAAQANSSAYRLGSKMDALLSQAGLSRRHVSEAADTPNSIGNYVKFDDGEGPSGGGHNDGDNGDAPTTGYMAKLKAMLAYENSRRKRLNRIKSKTYRRILRKEKEREKERRQKAFELLHPELARQRLAERMLKARAEERVTQKHKNTSAWVKHAKRFAQFDENTKDAIDDQHATHQRLMQKMEQDAGEDNYARYMAGDDESEASSEEDRAVDALIEKFGASDGAPLSAKEVKSILWSSVDAADDEDGTAAAAGGKANPIARARAELREMKFMKNAREREEKEYQGQIEALQRDIKAYQQQVNAGEGAEEEEAIEGHHPAKAPVSAGRITFKAGKRGQGVEQVQLRKQSGIRLEQSNGAEGESDASQSDDTDADSIVSVPSADDEDGSEEVKKAEKILSSSSKAVVESKRPTVSCNAATAPTSEFAGARLPAQTGEKKKKASTSTRVAILPKKRVRYDESVVGELASVSEGKMKGDEVDVTEEDLRLHQEYLISRAFAHDDVDEDFIKEKEAQVETIMRPEDKNQSLPGWGEWGGEDPELNKRHQEAVQHQTTQRQIEKSFLLKSRADAALEHVIINHDGVELVPDRMTLHMVPRPFSNPQEFARSMRQPMGPEWMSALSFKEGVQPRVEVHQGQSILPLDLSLRKKNAKTKRRKTEAANARSAA
ncbi:hypothetical protein ABL78_1284 [Leptomonas seymouri]|uniref:U3 small nucleolar RNA-associated protein 14 n=1 Tax=Leptomonas seymouri TaxID=5684 RepID=A0A0N0P872_LEPSE|nr:hypothetical protein ABL78_1284 [Leptomonas seymouri]|eukprot:KPI89619.1 hypothetical protein ABL78_1284 [Leptomonas seymouri]